MSEFCAKEGEGHFEELFVRSVYEGGKEDQSFLCKQPARHKSPRMAGEESRTKYKVMT